MDSMSEFDVITPSADLVQVRLTAAISIKQEMAAGSYADTAVDIARVMITALRSGHKVIFFGNGGSAQDAGHLSAELMGRFAFDRPGLSAMSLPDATAAMTAIGNDYSYAYRNGLAVSRCNRARLQRAGRATPSPCRRPPSCGTGRQYEVRRFRSGRRRPR
jgi:hypothetical protein